MIKTMELKEWAKNEIGLAIVKETDPDFVKSYNDAYLAFCQVMDILEKSKKSSFFTKSILMELLRENPLTPIEDNESEWLLIGSGEDDENKEEVNFIFQHKRRSTLFKQTIVSNREYKEVKYSDTDRATCIDIDTEEMYIGGVGMVLLNELVPITFPYSPNGTIKIYTEDFKYYEESETDDTIGVLYFRFPDGQMKEVKRFFKKDYKTGEMVEIDRQEYFIRRAKKKDNKKEKTE